MKKITLIYVGNIKKKFLKETKDYYLKLLRPYINFKEIIIKPEKFNDNNKSKIIKEENEKILKILKNFSESKIFILSEGGNSFDSISFNQKVVQPNSEMVFVVFGSLGFARKEFEQYEKISLSKLTFPHELSQVILLEQIYRSITISRNKTYHY